FLNKFRERDNQRLKLLTNTVIEPRWLSLQVLPPEYASMVRSAAETVRRLEKIANKKRPPPVIKWGEDWDTYADFLEYTAKSMEADIPQQEDMRVEFYHNIQKLETRRKVSFKETFPEYQKFLELCERPWRERQGL
ncbi:MAG TPA: hypothetical protein VM432_12315, partial [Bdellovibrionales bacterium]|nr:hypothetical protein [Bdellovibrionales bacterium]